MVVCDKISCTIQIIESTSLEQQSRMWYSILCYSVLTNGTRCFKEVMTSEELCYKYNTITATDGSQLSCFALLRGLFSELALLFYPLLAFFCLFLTLKFFVSLIEH